jgi:hypothetical protein
MRLPRLGVATGRSSKRLFCFLDNRQGALADGLHGLNPRNTGLGTPPSIPTSLSARD